MKQMGEEISMSTVIENVKNVIKNSEKYSFIWEQLVILISLGGSYAYGTNTENSDIDIRGIIHEPREALLGLSGFEQMERHDREKDIDCVLYGLKKMCNLLLGNNPNCIEILSPQEHNIVFMNDAGRVLIENRHLFLSKRSAFTFGAYAKAQLARLENALCHDRLSQPRQEEHMVGSIERMVDSFNTKYANFDNGSIKIYTDKKEGSDSDLDTFIDISLKHYPLRDYRGMWSEMSNVVKDYTKLNGRNNKKDIPHLCKHMMHLVRLYLMGIDILEKEEIITYRENDVDLLMSIRNGDYMLEGGKIDSRFYTLVDNLNHIFRRAVDNSKLPDKPDFKSVEKLVININKQYLQ